MGTTWAYPPPAAPPFTPNTGPSEGLPQGDDGVFPSRRRASPSPTVVVVLPSPAGLWGMISGDAVRFAANFVEEDSPDAAHAGINLEILRGFAEGFLAQTHAVLTPAERDTLCAELLCADGGACHALFG